MSGKSHYLVDRLNQHLRKESREAPYSQQYAVGKRQTGERVVSSDLLFVKLIFLDVFRCLPK